jgi:integrase
MIKQIMESSWVDKSKNNACITVCQYAKFLGIKINRPVFRIYDNREMYVPSPEMVKQFVYRIRKLSLRSMVLIAIETGASASEVWNVLWKDVNLGSKQIVIKGSKGHRTNTYSISDVLCTLLMQLPKDNDKVFTSICEPMRINESIISYRKRLAVETGNNDFHKIHFHTFRHFAISWKYFKCKDIVETQRFARHCNIQNTLRYIHIVKSWIRENEYDVVYTSDKLEFSKLLSEGYELVTNSEWGYCLRKPKTIT